nr:Gag-Pol polyprotein [Tanacetum cinerariifolium]
METIHVKFHELTTMASEHDCLEPELQRFNNINSLAKPMNTPSKEDLDNLFGPMFEEYFGKKSSDTPINSAAQPTQLHEDLSFTSLVSVEELHMDFKVCMYALTVNTIKPKNIKEAMTYHSWIESMQDELNQFERLQVWELVPRPEGKNIIALKWIWKKKCADIAKSQEKSQKPGKNGHENGK